MTEDECLRRFGVRAAPADLPEIREILRGQTEAEGRRQGDGDTELMKLCCVQLFSGGHLEDVLPIWRAKRSSMDAGCSIDIQLLCGAGLAATKEHLAAHGSAEASAALDRLQACESSGDFDGFTVDGQLRGCLAYYGDAAAADEAPLVSEEGGRPA